MFEKSEYANVSINPLRLSPPLGAILAFLGMEKQSPYCMVRKGVPLLQKPC